MPQSAAIGSCSSFFYQGFQSTLMQRTTNRNWNAGRQLAKPRTSLLTPEIGTRLPRRARHGPNLRLCSQRFF